MYIDDYLFIAQSNLHLFEDTFRLIIRNKFGKDDILLNDCKIGIQYILFINNIIENKFALLASSNNTSQPDGYLFRNYDTNASTDILPITNIKIKLIDCLMSCISPPDKKDSICDGNIFAFKPTEVLIHDLETVLFYYY